MFSKKEFMNTVRKSNGDISKSLEINISTLYRKINGVSDFYSLEICKICTVLNITDPTLIFYRSNFIKQL